ncbi:MAG: hypothetical protein M1821_002034 [Bathelium mastoideum]|nr:MAG: hypothetical protein M1821_002034 [Bathelium mastoideum]
MKHVYYLPRYRDETTVKANRGSNWNRRRLKLPPEQPLPLCLQKKQARHTRAHDLTKTIVEPRKSFLNEVLALTSGFAETREIWCLEELEKALDLAEKNLEFRPLHENTASHMFVDGQDRIDEGTANLMKAELVKIWPELGDITEENILRMSRGLMRYREHSEGKEQDDDEWLGRFVKVYKSVKRITPPLESRPPIQGPKDHVLLKALVNKLVDVKTANDNFSAALKNAFGDATEIAMPQELWARWVAVEMERKNQGMWERLEELIRLMSQMQFV